MKTENPIETENTVVKMYLYACKVSNIWSYLKCLFSLNLFLMNIYTIFCNQTSICDKHKW